MKTLAGELDDVLTGDAMTMEPNMPTKSIEADVTNSGAMAGEETVLLFVRDVVARPAAPMLELRGTTKLTFPVLEYFSV